MNVPWPVFQSTSTPLVVVTTRSVWPSPFRSAAAQPSPWTGRSACAAALTSLNVPSTFSNNAVRGRPPCASHCGGVRARVRVDDEQVLPAVVVVVEPAEAAAHHRLGVVRHAVAERALLEVEAERRREVGQPQAGEGGALGAARCDLRRRRHGERPVAARLLVQLVGLAGELCDRDRRVLAAARREVQRQPVGGRSHGRSTAGRARSAAPCGDRAGSARPATPGS